MLSSDLSDPFNSVSHILSISPHSEKWLFFKRSQLLFRFVGS